MVRVKFFVLLIKGLLEKLVFELRIWLLLICIFDKFLDLLGVKLKLGVRDWEMVLGGLVLKIEMLFLVFRLIVKVFLVVMV